MRLHETLRPLVHQGEHQGAAEHEHRPLDLDRDVVEREDGRDECGDRSRQDDERTEQQPHHERAAALAGMRRPKTGAFPVLYDERISSGLIGHLLSRGVRRQTPMASLGLLGEA